MINKETLENTDEGLIIRLKIIPNSSRNEAVWENGALKIKITAQPIENKANKALIAFFSKKLKTAKSNIKIVKGELNKEKTLLIYGFDEESFLDVIR
ncbi:MAG: DUF167 domain-containing protein [bacterium]